LEPSFGNELIFVSNVQRSNIDRIITWMIEENIYKEEDIQNQWENDFIGWMLKLVANDRFHICGFGAYRNRSGVHVSAYKPGYEFDPNNPTVPRKQRKVKSEL
jgi:peptidyl-tRNA hydrolase